MDKQEKSELVDIQAQALQKAMRNHDKEMRMRKLKIMLFGPIVISIIFVLFVLAPLHFQRENETLKPIETVNPVRRK